MEPSVPLSEATTKPPLALAAGRESSIPSLEGFSWYRRLGCFFFFSFHRRGRTTAYVTPGPHDFQWNRASCPDNDRDDFTYRPQIARGNHSHRVRPCLWSCLQLTAYCYSSLFFFVKRGNRKAFRIIRAGNRANSILGSSLCFTEEENVTGRNESRKELFFEQCWCVFCTLDGLECPVFFVAFLIFNS